MNMLQIYAFLQSRTDVIPGSFYNGASIANDGGLNHSHQHQLHILIQSARNIFK